MYAQKAIKCYLAFLWIMTIPMGWVMFSGINFGFCVQVNRQNLTHILECVDSETGRNFYAFVGALIFVLNAVAFSSLYCAIQIEARRQEFIPSQEQFITQL